MGFLCGNIKVLKAFHKGKDNADIKTCLGQVIIEQHSFIVSS
jgi:hypothetical protein